MKKTNGFTLIEILIALFIFVIVSMLTASALFLMIDAKKSNQAHAKNFTDIQMTMTLLQRDVTAIVNRSIHNNAGQSERAVVLQTHPVTRLDLTTIGNSPLYPRQSHLLRVAYQYDHQRLSRMTWDVLDREADSKAQRRVVLKNLRSFTIHVLAADHRDTNIWPSNDIPPPLAFKFDFCFKRRGCFSRFIYYPGKLSDAPLISSKR